MKELAPKIYQFPPQFFFGERVGIYAIEQLDMLYCFDIPADTRENREFLSRFRKPIRIIMSHGPTSNGLETTRDSLREQGLDVEIWLHEEDDKNVWLTVQPDVLLSRGDRNISENLTLLFTPGHSKGSVCLYADICDGFIFTGDTLGGTRKGNIRPFELKTNDLGKDIFFRSLTKLLAYDFKTMLPFHYYPITDAKRKLREFIARYTKNNY